MKDGSDRTRFNGIEPLVSGGWIGMRLAGPKSPSQHGPRRFVLVRPNVRAKRATTAGRQARAGENVPRTTGPGLVACRWRSA